MVWEGSKILLQGRQECKGAKTLRAPVLSSSAHHNRWWAVRSENTLLFQQFFKEPVLLVSPFSRVSNAFFVLRQDSYWHQTWSNSHFLSEWVSQCCSDGKGEIHACLFVLRPHSSSYFHFCPPISLFSYYPPAELSYSSLLPFHLCSLLSLLILPQNFCLKGLLPENYKQCLHSHACSKPGHMIITLLFPCLSHSTATVWGCECWTLLSCPLSQGTVLIHLYITFFPSRSG